MKLDPKLCTLLEQVLYPKQAIIITMTGTLCPITVGHVDACVTARSMLQTEFPEAVILCFLGLNSESHASAKLQEKNEPGGCSGVTLADRGHLVSLASSNFDWLSLAPGGRPGYTETRSAMALVARDFPHLDVIEYSLNGADE